MPAHFVTGVAKAPGRGADTLNKGGRIGHRHRPGETTMTTILSILGAAGFLGALFYFHRVCAELERSRAEFREWLGSIEGAA